jgi:peptidyl-prolyl cis-trans isomerase D
VKSEFGFHIIRLDQIVPGGPLPLDQVRTELERELRDAQGDVEFRKKVRAISDALFDAKDLQSIATTAGLPVLSASGFTRSGDEPFGSNQAAIDAVFDPRILRDGGISDIVEIDANRSVVLRVTHHQEAQRQALSQVRDRIVDAVRHSRAEEIVRERVAALETALGTGAAFVEAASAAGASAKPYTVVDRQNEEMDGRVLEAVYRAKKPLSGKPRIGTAVSNSGDYAVFSIDAVAPGRPENVPLAERDARKESLAGQAGGADYTAFVLQLEREADIVRSEDALAEQDPY